ncbi:hypothetical protein SAVIM40S_07421 [Streptomyces avidinii]
MRVAGGGELRVGRKVAAFTVTEITDPEQKARILRAYLEKWGWEVNRFFPGGHGQVLRRRAPGGRRRPPGSSGRRDLR